ncbi:MAG: MerR family transcriptional regulator [Acidithiobacillus sp.]
MNRKNPQTARPRSAAAVLSIGQVAKNAGVHVETIRFYEREGLIAQPPRPSMGIRRYPQDTVHRIRFIKHAQALGFSLQECRELLELRGDDPQACALMRHHAQEKLSAIRAKLQALTQMEGVLTELLEACQQGRIGRDNPCPILKALDAED